MALVNIEEWLAARGPRGTPATTGANPGAPRASLPPDVEQGIADLAAEIARQGDLIQRLQAALATELDRNAQLVARIRGVSPAAAQARAPSRVIRKRRGASGEDPVPPRSPPTAA